MFAGDVGHLPDTMFTCMFQAGRRMPKSFQTLARTLFAALRTGGMVGFEQVEWFIGGLFDSTEALPLEWQDLDDLIRAAALDWSEMDRAILGTFFERGLDPDKRSQLGVQYTNRDTIMQIIEPVIIRPFLAEWAEAKARV